MKGLLVKDLLLINERKTTILLAVIIVGATGFMMETGFMTSFLPLFSAILMLTTLSFDELDNGMAFLMTMPIRRKDYAIEKYVLGALMGVGALVLSVILEVVLGTLNGNGVNVTELMINLLIGALIFTLILMVMLPLDMKYGVEKGRIAMFIIYGAVFGIAILVSKVADKSNFDIDAIVAKITNSNPVLVIGAVVAFVVIALLASMCISIKVMKNKEY